MTTLNILNLLCFSPSEDESWPPQSEARRPVFHHRGQPPEAAEVVTRPPISAPPPRPAPSLEDKPAPASPQLAMVSRRAIISRSRDDLQHHLGVNNKNFTGEDQWFSKEKLYKVKQRFSAKISIFDILNDAKE